MKMKMRPRYYCDHCGKASGSAYAMRRHEAACTMNPARTCRMCALLGLGKGRLAEGKAAFLDPVREDWPARMDALRKATDNCPCCILAVMRQTGTTTPVPDDEEGRGGYPEGSEWQSPLNGSHCLLGFHYQAEMKAALERADEVRDAAGGNDY